MGINPSSKRLWVFIVMLLGLLGGVTFWTFEKKANLEDIEVEKSSLVQDLKALRSQLQEQIGANDTLNGFFSLEIQRLEKVIDSVSLANITSAKELGRLEVLVRSLEGKITRRSAQVDSLDAANATLKLENSTLKLESEAALSEVSESLKSEKQRNSVLTQLNDRLSRDRAIASRLQLSHLEANAYRVTRIGMEKATAKAKEADRIKVCQTIAKNNIASKGKHMFYLKVFNSDNSLLGSSGKAKIAGKLVEYTLEQEMDFNGESTGCCFTYDLTSPLTEGSYLVEVYSIHEKIGEGRIYLD